MTDSSVVTPSQLGTVLRIVTESVMEGRDVGVAFKKDVSDDVAVVVTQSNSFARLYRVEPQGRYSYRLIKDDRHD